MARKTGIIAGILALILAFISEIPIFPPENLFIDLYIFLIDNVRHYYWGYVFKNKGYTLIKLPSPENLVALSIWILILLIGINSIMASTTKANILKSAKLYKVNIILSLAFLFIFGFIAVLIIYPDIMEILYILGYGYYLTVLILILNIIALKKITKKKD